MMGPGGAAAPVGLVGAFQGATSLYLLQASATLEMKAEVD
jgi:hypothetical protein